VVLDIGEGVGAAVIYTDSELEGQELEIRPASGEWRGVHTAVRERTFGGAMRCAAVFGSLREGSWELRVRGSSDATPVLGVYVPGGSVVEALWP
jgi:hypothetical protein